MGEDRRRSRTKSNYHVGNEAFSTKHSSVEHLSFSGNWGICLDPTLASDRETACFLVLHGYFNSSDRLGWHVRELLSALRGAMFAGFSRGSMFEHCKSL
jgi:hypothetical protein